MQGGEYYNHLWNLFCNIASSHNLNISGVHVRDRGCGAAHADCGCCAPESVIAVVLLIVMWVLTKKVRQDIRAWTVGAVSRISYSGSGHDRHHCLFRSLPRTIIPCTILPSVF